MICTGSAFLISKAVLWQEKAGYPNKESGGPTASRLLCNEKEATPMRIPGGLSL